MKDAPEGHGSKEKERAPRRAGGAPFGLWATFEVMLTALLQPVQALLSLAGPPEDPSPPLPGELRLFFPGCRAVAAPVVLFRLKRSGYSRCLARASGAGLAVSCRR